MYNRPDFSKYLIHFTKDRKPDSSAQNNPALFLKGTSAKERLLHILDTKQIIASRLTTGNTANACCFTECIWGSLLTHARRYSAYGIGFTKNYISQKEGNPVFYIGPQLFNMYNKEEKLLPFLALYDPLNEKKVIDYTHEREWRIAETLQFTYKDIAFIVLKSYKDIPDFQEFINKIGEDKVILMDNYKKVETLWPLLNVNTK